MTTSNLKSVTIVVPIDGDYIGDVKRRLEEHGIAHAELARQMGVDPPQVSRWFNRTNDSGKPMQPSMENAVRIEKAILEILRQRRNGKRPAK